MNTSNILQEERKRLFEQGQRRDRAVQFINLTTGNDDGVFYYEDENAIASCCHFSPLTGVSQSHIQALQSMLDTEMPSGTMMQFILMANPVLDNVLNNYTHARQNVNLRNIPADIDHSAIESARFAVQNRSEFLASGVRSKLVSNVETTLTETNCFWTIRVPVKTKNPFDGGKAQETKFNAEVEEFLKLRTQLISQMEVGGIYAKVMKHKEVLALIRKYFAMYDPYDFYYDEDELLRDQIFPIGSKISWESRGSNRIHCSGFSKNHERQNVEMLVINRYPGEQKNGAHINKMIQFLGHPSGSGAQIGCPYIMTTTIHFPDQAKKASAFRQSQTLTMTQARPFLLKWSPRLQKKKLGFETMDKARLEGGNIVETTTSLMLFHSSFNHLDKAINRLQAYYQTLGFHFGKERYIHAISFFNNIPMNASPESIKNTDRFKTMMGAHAVHLLPITDEYKGIPNPNGDEMLLTTRLGRLFRYSLFSPANNNFNWTMIAGAGSGKSFFVQRLTQDHLSLGTKIWTIDTGSSYLAAARAAGAQIIDFDFTSHVCLNPFTKIDNLNEEIELLVPIFAKMAKPNEGFSDIEKALMTDAIRSVYMSRGNRADIDDVINFLSNQQGDNASIQRDLAMLLSEFGEHGSMGYWFKGENNFKAEADWTVLELSGLITNKHLCDVVLMMISTTISQEMFLSRDGRKKMLIIEEGGDRITDPSFAEFVAKLYSKVRKEDGSVGVVTQTFNQIHATEFGKSIMASAWTQFYMQQSPEDIQSALNNGWLEVDGYTRHLLSQCRTEKGRFSEVIIRSGQSSGLARLIETPFNRVLFSTEGDFFKELQRKVRNGEQIIDIVMAEARRRYPDEFST